MKLPGLCLAFIFTLRLAQSAHAQIVQGQRIATEATARFYEDQGTSEVWNDANYDALIAAIEGLSAHGLEPAHYRLARLRELRHESVGRDRVATSAWLMAAAHLAYGKLDAVSVEPDWTVIHHPTDFTSVLRYALQTGNIAGSLEQFAPIQPGYRALVSELANLRAEAEIPMTQVPAGPTMRENDLGVRVSALQTRLKQLGFLAEEFEISGVFGEDTVIAVETFQAQQGLEADGIVGTATITALNRGVTERINQVRVNLERWRWLPADLGRRHLRANIAGFEVTAYEDGQPVQTHLTIVGRNYRRTPVFSDEIEYIVFNPWWETPTSLARADKLPMFQRDPGAVTRLGFQVLNAAGQVVDPSTINWNDYSASNFPFRLRQAPGPDNALGQVKIMFPNVHNVYLHDTPSRGLFAQSQRAFSSGCLRTQYPIELSRWLLEETTDWTSERVDQAVASGRETRATLAARVPVHILYFTAVNDGLGGVRYLDDIYDRDARVLRGLGEPPQVE
ncbi:L,D-transpeptidase family protein [Ponticaulis sp.]|uniref:L,D-transpeptidase family protein n=1 Tax=Ponticaulis sp. TaxID=2020902 RepID=UPI0025D9D0F4|nr:L,D-transpeptidase family protein [Ponticaulis sp.]